MDWFANFSNFCTQADYLTSATFVPGPSAMYFAVSLRLILDRGHAKIPSAQATLTHTLTPFAGTRTICSFLLFWIMQSTLLIVLYPQYYHVHLAAMIMTNIKLPILLYVASSILQAIKNWIMGKSWNEANMQPRYYLT